MEGAFPFAERGFREGGLLLRLGVGDFLRVGFDAEGVLCWAVKEVEVFLIFAVFNGSKESEFLGIFGNLADVFIFEQCFPHLGEFSTLSSLACFGVIL